MRTWWVYNNSIRFKGCAQLAVQAFDRDRRLDVRNERPAKIRRILWRIDAIKRGESVSEEIL